jgi:hypothetical protein
MCFFEIVIASVAKQSIRGKYGGYGLLRRFAPRNDAKLEESEPRPAAPSPLSDP